MTVSVYSSHKVDDNGAAQLKETFLHNAKKHISDPLFSQEKFEKLIKECSLKYRKSTPGSYSIVKAYEAFDGDIDKVIETETEYYQRRQSPSGGRYYKTEDCDDLLNALATETVRLYPNRDITIEALPEYIGQIIFPIMLKKAEYEKKEDEILLKYYRRVYERDLSERQIRIKQIDADIKNFKKLIR